MIRSLTLAFALTMALTGCSDKKPAATTTAKPAATAKPTAAAKPAAEAKPAAKPAAAADPAAEAKSIFTQRCVLCHGANGLGDGVAGKSLNPKPRNWTDAKWQDATKDETIAKAIVEGGAAIGKSPTMPGNPDLKGKDAVVKELVKIIRAFKK